MDLAQFDRLESGVTALLKSYTHVKTDNEQLSQRVRELEGAIAVQQKELAQLQNAQAELHELRSQLQLLRQEREVIQQKLRQMLSTIEWLEAQTHITGNANS